MSFPRELATIRVRRGLELQVGIIKKEGMEHRQSTLDVGPAFFRAGDWR